MLYSTCTGSAYVVWCGSNLEEHFQYQNAEKTKMDVMTALHNYRGLIPKLEKFGESSQSLNDEDTCLPLIYSFIYLLSLFIKECNVHRSFS